MSRQAQLSIVALPLTVSQKSAELDVAAGILTRTDGRVLISRRLPGSHMEGAWEFPGGKVAAGETALEALVRELREELDIRVHLVRHLVRFSHTYPDRIVHLHIWRVLGWSGEAQGCEGQPLRWLAPDQLKSAGLLPADQRIIEALQADCAVNTLDWRSVEQAVTDGVQTTASSNSTS